MNDKTRKIAKLNDEFRQAIGTDEQSGRILITPGIAELPRIDKIKILFLVKTFNNFAKDIDVPTGQRDYGRIDYNDQIVLWKIDYIDKLDDQVISLYPDDPQRTERILTVMFGFEW